jgi:CHAD domain-containing protein
MREYVRAQTDALLRRVAFQVSRAAKSADAEAIHDLRVAIRRLSRCLRVFSQFYPDKSWKKIRRRLDSLMSLAGAVRDLDIALDLLGAAQVAPQAPVVRSVRAERYQANRDFLREVRLWKSRGYSKKWRGALDLSS